MRLGAELSRPQTAERTEQTNEYVQVERLKRRENRMRKLTENSAIRVEDQCRNNRQHTLLGER